MCHVEYAAIQAIFGSLVLMKELLHFLSCVLFIVYNEEWDVNGTKVEEIHNIKIFHRNMATNY